jgi:hypothetical protein
MGRALNHEVSMLSYEKSSVPVRIGDAIRRSWILAMIWHKLILWIKGEWIVGSVESTSPCYNTDE